MNKRIVSKEELQKKMVLAMADIAGIVKRTLGPGGQPILIERVGQQPNGDPLGPKITKDGVSVADECSDPDPVKDLVIQAIKKICRKTNMIAGDGTTGAVVLGEAILVNMLEELQGDKNLNPQLVRESVEAAAKEVIEQLQARAVPVRDPAVIAQVATISANGEKEIGEIIGQAFQAVGAEGVVVVDEGSGLKTTLEVVQGYQIQKGAELRDLFFNNQERTKYEAQNVRVLIYDGVMSSFTHLRTALQALLSSTVVNGQIVVPPMLIIANEFSGEVLHWLQLQKMEAGFDICAIRGPNTTNVRSSYYEDFAVLSDGVKLGAGGRSLEAAQPADFGMIQRVVVDKYTTTLFGGRGTEEAILARVDALKAQKESAESPYDAQILSDRIAALTSGIAKIGVGGATDLEIKEKYDRIEDALNAARAAILEGVIPGGGTTLFRIATSMEPKTVGHRILKEALQAPLNQILDNIERDLSEEESQQIIANDTMVFDARNKVIAEAFAAGILDPVKVSRTALENAVSIASLLSTAGGGIVFVPEKKSN